MNERIRELMKQATEEELDYTESGVPFVVREFVPEKFAELLVRQCALTAGLMEQQGRTGIGAQLLDNFEIKD